MLFPAAVGLASVDLSFEYFGRRFNQHPIAIIDMPEPSDTGKVLREFFLEMHDLAVRGVFLKGKQGGDEWLHKPFLKGHLADAVARYISLSLSLSLSFPLFVVVGGAAAAFADVTFCISPPPLTSLHNASSIFGGDE